MKGLTADIYLHNEFIGRLTSDGCQSKVIFNESYLNNPYRNTLSLSVFSMDPDKLELFCNPGSPLPPFIQSALPEDGPLRERILDDSGMTIDKNSFSADAYLLKVVGSDLIGAIEIKNVTTENIYDEFHEEIPEYNPESNKNPYFSLGGVQDKFSFNRQGNKFVLPMQGEQGEYIVKPQPQKGNLYNLALNEYFHMRLASLCGLKVPEIGLINNNEIKDLGKFLGSDAGNNQTKNISYYIKRFDREKNGKIHIEELHQALRLEGLIDGDSKYEDFTVSEILFFLNQVDQKLNSNLLMEYLKELSFSLAIGNTDFHIKNTAILYLNRVIPVKAPSYDLVNTQIYNYQQFSLKPGLAGFEDGILIDEFDERVLFNILEDLGLDLSLSETINNMRKKVFENLQAVFNDPVFQRFSNSRFSQQLKEFYQNRNSFDLSEKFNHSSMPFPC